MSIIVQKIKYNIEFSKFSKSSNKKTTYVLNLTNKNLKNINVLKNVNEKIDNHLSKSF